MFVFHLVILITAVSGLRDCTNKFKNRVASFEYTYYQGYWLGIDPTNIDSSDGTPGIGWAPLKDVKNRKGLHWYLHDCGDSVCMEWLGSYSTSHYLGSSSLTGHSNPTDSERFSVGVTIDTNLQSGSNEDKKFQIWCTDCNPLSDQMTHSECEIRKDSLKLFCKKDSRVNACKNCGDDSWYKWRIQSPTTKESWKVVVDIENNSPKGRCNCDGKGNDCEGHEEWVTNSISTTKSTSETLTIEAKISAGAFAAKLLGLEGGASRSFTTELINNAAHEEKTKLKVNCLPPGKRWVVQQLVGTAGYTTLSVKKFKNRVENA